MTRTWYPVTLRHDEGGSHTIGRVSRVSHTAVAAVIRKNWAAIEGLTGDRPQFALQLARGLPPTPHRYRVVYRGGPWTVEAFEPVTP